MKSQTVVLIILVLLLGLTGCSSDSPTSVPPGDSYRSAALDTTHEGALSVRNQLALGTLELAGSPNAITQAQAKTLLPLWQLLLNSQKTGTAAEAEISAVLQGIEDGLSDEQLAAISAMMLTQTDLQNWASANGIPLGSGSGSGQGQGQGQGMSPEARATRQAEEGRTPGSPVGGASTALLTAVIGYLETLVP